MADYPKIPDCPALNRLLADGGMQIDYQAMLDLAEKINLDAILREVCDLQTGSPADCGIMVARALNSLEVQGWHKCRRAIGNLLDLQNSPSATPGRADFGADDKLRQMGYDPEEIPDKD